MDTIKAIFGILAVGFLATVGAIALGGFMFINAWAEGSMFLAHDAGFININYAHSPLYVYGAVGTLTLILILLGVKLMEKMNADLLWLLFLPYAVGLVLGPYLYFTTYYHPVTWSILCGC